MFCKNPSRAGIGAQDFGPVRVGALIGARFLDQAGPLGGGAKPLGLLRGSISRAPFLGGSAGRPVHAIRSLW